MTPLGARLKFLHMRALLRLYCCRFMEGFEGVRGLLSHRTALERWFDESPVDGKLSDGAVC